jgi:hypothetical protein
MDAPDPGDPSNQSLSSHLVPIRRSFARTIGAALFSASLLLTAMPGASLALDPPRPLPGYHPTFVTEREAGPWEDCAWAAAAMLLDKWTNGVTTVGRERLRALSKDKTGGSSFYDIQRSFARLGLPLRWSPSGGDRITWTRLLDRLGHGSGAIVFGDYGKLPRRYGRWDPSFWRNTGLLDDHALYLDAYDRKTRRILVMDPLAPAGWHGEWMPVSAIKKFTWHSGSALWAATTPTALAAPFVGVDLGQPTATGDAVALHVTWPVETAPKAWTAPGFSATAHVEAVAEPDPYAPDIAAFPPDPAVARLSAPRTSGDADSLNAALPLPRTPGIYRVTVSLADTRFGRPLTTAGPFNLYVPGPRAWRFAVPDEQEIDPGSLAKVSFVVANVGTESWAEPPYEAGPSQAEAPLPLNARLVGTWVGPSGTAGHRASAPPDIEFGPTSLEPGYTQPFDALVRVPAEPGQWQLVVRVVENRDRPSAFVGSAPGVMTFDVLDHAEVAAP